MKLIFCISAYQDPAQLGRLVKQLARLDCQFVIHIDARVDQAPFARAVAGLEERCQFISPRIKVAWGGFSQVRYQLAMLRAAAEGLGPDDRVFLLSGSDYPVCRSGELLRRSAGSGDLLRAKAIGPGSPYRASERYRLLHLRDLDLGWRLANRVAITLIRNASRLIAPFRDRTLRVDGREWRIHVGSSYMGLSGATVQHILQQLEQNPQILMYFRHTFVPEEMVIPTVLFNSARGRELTLVENIYALPHLSATHYFAMTDKVHVLDAGDLEAILASGKLFGRKFATGISEALMDRLDAIWSAEPA